MENLVIIESIAVPKGEGAKKRKINNGGRVAKNGAWPKRQLEITEMALNRHLRSNKG